MRNKNKTILQQNILIKSNSLKMAVLDKVNTFSKRRRQNLEEKLPNLSSNISTENRTLAQT
jgi:actin-like ATPase involved in cell morphogenesis